MTAFVTCIYDGLHGTPFGGRRYRGDMFRQSLEIIADSGVRIFCYTSAAERPELERTLASPGANITWISAELTDHPHSAAIHDIKRRFPEKFTDLLWRERCVEIMWGKPLMLQRVLESHPELQRAYWVDAGLASDTLLPSRYRCTDLAPSSTTRPTAFPADIAERLDAFRDGRLLTLACTVPHNAGIPATYNARPYVNANGVIGGLFGGARRDVLTLATAFRAKCEVILARGELYPEESILTGLVADHPDWFTTFVFDSWYHEDWSQFDPAVVNFSQFFDRLLSLDVRPASRVIPPRAAPARPEQFPARSVVMACLNVGTGRTTLDSLAPLLLHADWTTVLKIAQQERVTSWLHRALKDSPLVPSQVRGQLHQHYRETGARIAQMRTALAEAVRVLDRHGVPVVLLKGAALQYQLWEGIGLRPWSDLDLLVRPSDVDAAVTALATVGYRIARTETRPGTTIAHESELLLEGPGGMLIDLHWSLFDSPAHQFSSADSDLVSQRHAVDVGGVPAAILSPEAQLLHLCGHLTLHHGGSGLLWLNDIAQLVSRYRNTLDWSAVVAGSQACRLVLPVQRMLAAIEELAADVPPDALTQIRAMTPDEAELRAVEAADDPARSMAARLLSDLRAIPRWSVRLALLRSRLWPSWEYMKARYQVSHPVAVALAYPYRWAIGLARVPGSTGGHLRDHTAHASTRKRLSDRGPRRRTTAVPPATDARDLPQRDGNVGLGAVRRPVGGKHTDDDTSGLPGRTADTRAGHSADPGHTRRGRRADDGVIAAHDVSFAGVRCVIRARDADSARLVGFFAGHLAADADPELTAAAIFDVSACEDPDHLQLQRDGVVLSHKDTRGGLASQLAAEVATVVSTQATPGLIFHAASVVWNGRALVLPGASGAGKTTLTAQLVYDGLSYLSDELTCVMADGATVSGFGRPLALKTGSWPPLERALQAIPDARDVLRFHGGLLVRPERLNPLGAGAPAPCHAIVFPRRASGRPAALMPLSPGAGSLALLATVVNAGNLPNRGVSHVAHLARRVPMYALEYDEAAEALPLLRTLLRN